MKKIKKMVRVQCPCGHIWKVKRSKIGEIIKCSKCKKGSILLNEMQSAQAMFGVPKHFETEAEENEYAYRNWEP